MSCIRNGVTLRINNRVHMVDLYRSNNGMYALIVNPKSFEDDSPEMEIATFLDNIAPGVALLNVILRSPITFQLDGKAVIQPEGTMISKVFYVEREI